MYVQMPTYHRRSYCACAITLVFCYVFVLFFQCYHCFHCFRFILFFYSHLKFDFFALLFYIFFLRKNHLSSKIFFTVFSTNNKNNETNSLTYTAHDIIYCWMQTEANFFCFRQFLSSSPTVTTFQAKKDIDIPFYLNAHRYGYDWYNLLRINAYVWLGRMAKGMKGKILKDNVCST